MPGSNESAGRVKSTKTRPGNHYLQRALGAAAMAWAQNPSTYLGARYRRIASRRGPKTANVAIQHSMLTAIWHRGRTGTLYDDPGADFFTRLHPEHAKTRALHQLEAMGYRVTRFKPVARRTVLAAAPPVQRLFDRARGTPPSARSTKAARICSAIPVPSL